MRAILLAAAMAAIAFSSVSPARAYGNAPWCLKANVGVGVVTERCDFPNFETCGRERPAWGNSAFCVQNSRYLPYWQGRFGDEPVRRPLRKTRRHH